MGRLDAKLKAKMAPSWVRTGKFLGCKNEAKRDVYWEPLGVDFSMDFASILEIKMEFSWHQIRIQHR